MDIEKLAQTLEISIDEARALQESDAQIDRMTKLSDINSDLTKEQQKVLKKMKNTSRVVNAYGKTVTRERKTDNTKREIIQAIQDMLSDKATDVQVTNVEREIVFSYNSRKFKLVLSAPRS